MTSGDDLRALRSIWLELVGSLELSKKALDEEIRTYPTPIPRCDAQFNYLYEQRNRLADQLERMRGTGDAGPSAGELVDLVASVLASAPCTERAEERTHREQLAAKLARLGSSAPETRSDGP